MLTPLVMAAVLATHPGSRVAAQDGGPAPSEAGGELAAEGAPGLPALPEGLLVALEEVEALRGGGDLEAARELLSEIVEGEPYAELLDAQQESALRGLSVIDVLAGRLGLPGIQERVRTERVELLSESCTADDLDLLRSIGNQALARKALGDLQGALELEQHVHAAFSRLLPPDAPDLLAAGQNLANSLFRLGDIEGARELQEDVHETLSRVRPADDPVLVTAEADLALLRKAQGDLEGALELEEHVHEVRVRTLPPDHPERLQAEMELAVTRKQLGDLEGALELFEHVHAARSRLLPPDHLDLLRAKANLAIARKALGDLEGALELEEHVLEARRRALPAEHPDVLRAIGNLANTRKDLGDLEGALALEEHVLSVWIRRLPAAHPELLVARQNLAATRAMLGDAEGALEQFEHVHAAWSRQFPPDHPDLLVARLNLAGVRETLGDLEGALELEESVLAAWSSLLPDDHPLLIQARENLAGTLYGMGDLASALELEEQVHAARSRALPADHPDLVRSGEQLGIIRAESGDIAGARERLEHVHAARALLLGDGHPDLLRARQNLAFLRRASGDVEGAAELTRALLQGQLVRAEELLTCSSRVARAGALEELRRFSWGLLPDVMTPDGAAGAGASELFAVIESLRLVSTASTEVALAIEGDPELERARDRLAGIRVRINDLSLAAPKDVADLDAWRAELVALAEERDGLERDLRTALRRRGVSTELPTSASVADRLSSDAVLISFLRYWKLDHSGPVSGRRSPAVDSLVAFVVEPDARTRLVDLGPAAPIEDLTARWRASLGSPVRPRGVPILEPADGRAEPGLGRQLRARLVDPCLAALGEATPSELHLVLDDFLHLLCVDALPLDGGGRLGDSIAVRTEASTRRLVAPPPPISGDGTLLALGGIDYDAEEALSPDLAIFTATPPVRGGDLRDANGPSLRGLPAALGEVETLGELYQGLERGEPVILSDRDATTRALSENADRARYLHIATHGWFAPERFRSMLDDAGRPRDGLHERLARANDTVRGFAPETLCGLALAGANRGVDENGRVPGIITAEELATLDLSSCELAVLSACETNVGIRRAGQGIQSLQSALHAAGARTAITSLWKVDDAATRRLMELFYTKLWKEGLGKADALWQAKMALREEGHPIRDWAGWVLTGDPD